LSHYRALYEERGEGRPLVVVPALAGGTGLTSLLAGALASSFRVISYNLRGEDDCFVLRRRFGLSDLVGDLAEFIDYLRLERPIVMGVSFGGALAIEFAGRYPHRLSGLIAQGTDIRFQRTLLRLVAGQVLSRYPLPDDSPFINQFFNLLVGSPLRDRVLLEFIAQQSWQTDQSVMAHRFQLAESIDLSDRLGTVRVPALIATGARDVLVSRGGVRELVNSLAHARHVRLADAGHFAFVTHAVALAHHVQRFAEEQKLT
jgi:pimeloyl-ACP methyl ester carboxylesterase